MAPHQLHQRHVNSNGTAQHTISLILPQEITNIRIVLAAVWPLTPQDHNPHEPSTLPMSASKPPVPKYRIIKGTRSDITSEDSKAVIRAEAAEHFGVIISEKHKWMKAPAKLPNPEKDRTVVLHTPYETPGTIQLGVCYVTNEKWRINQEQVEGHALVLMLGSGAPGEPYNDIQITLDGKAKEVKGAFVFLPEL